MVMEMRNIILPFAFLKENCTGIFLLNMFLMDQAPRIKTKFDINTGWPGTPGGPKRTEQSLFLELCSDQQLSFFTLLDRVSFPHYTCNNTKIMKFC